MVDKRNSLSSLVEKDVRDHFGEVVYKTTIPRNVKVSEALVMESLQYYMMLIVQDLWHI